MDSDPQTTAPYRVMESTARGNRFMVVDDRGDAEMGNWFIASTWWRADAEFIADCFAARLEAHPVQESWSATMPNPETTAKQALEWLRGELTALCEGTEDSHSLNDIAAKDLEGKMGAFARGRIHEAKGIRRAMGEMVREKMKELGA